MVKILKDKHLKIAEKKMKQKYKNFLSVPNIILGTDNDKGSFGVEIYKDFLWITWCYGDGKFETNYQLYEIIRFLFEKYSVEMNLPILYTFKEKNVFKNNSKHVTDGVWQFIPKGCMI